jgi:outer membrane protein OmpA-like peptidoglycan-associated protein
MTQRQSALRTWILPAFLATASFATTFVGAAAPAHALDLGSLTKKAAGGAHDAALKKVNAKLLAEGRKNQCAFKSDSDELMPGCGPKVKKLADTLVKVKKDLQMAGVTGYKFEVSGHTDTTGKPEHNKELSAKRAAVMVRELVAKGIAQNEIVAVGMGADHPLVTPDDTEAKKKKNRRYEIQVR